MSRPNWTSEYGAIDIRVTPEGEYVFLEVNPAGQFLCAENATGLLISDARAGHLLRAVEPLVPALSSLAIAEPPKTKYT